MTKEKLNFLKVPITILLLMLFVNKFGGSTEFINKNRITEEKIELKLTPVNVWDKIIEYKIEHPKIVFSQVMLETGQLKSKGARIDNNLFGFFIRGNYHVFESWDKSIEYYKEWQDRKYNGGNYHNFLTKVGYAKDSMYISKLITMQNKLFRLGKYGME